MLSEIMETVLADLTLLQLISALGIAVLAGIVKGVVGFAMPTVMISGLSSVLAPDVALAALILPTLVTNGMQALRQGLAEALASMRRFGVFLGAGLCALLVSSQLVAILPLRALLLAIGLPVTLFGLAQLAGWQPRLSQSRPVEIGLGGLSGFIGGMSGIWGPTTVTYLTALGVEKREQMRVQGVIYGIGAVALALAHTGSGVLNASTVWLSAALIPPAVLGMWLGGLVQDRIDQQAFRRATLAVLVVAGLNLLRRALF